MNTELILFSLFSSLSLIAAIMVIRAKNPVHSVLFLILVFCSTSGLLLLLNLDFFALIFLVVYVGAIAVLFLFVIMMLNIKLTEINENILRYLPIGGLIGLVFIFEILLVVDTDLIPLFDLSITFIPVLEILFGLLFVFEKETFLVKEMLNHYTIELFTIDNIFPNSYANWICEVQNFSNIEMIAELVYTYYVCYFIMASLILLVAMIGAITLTMHKNVTVKRQDVFLQHVREFSATVQKIR